MREPKTSEHFCTCGEVARHDSLNQESALRARNAALLAALKAMLEHGTRTEWTDDNLAHSFKLPVTLIRQARAAIEKAEGK